MEPACALASSVCPNPVLLGADECLIGRTVAAATGLNLPLAQACVGGMLQRLAAICRAARLVAARRKALRARTPRLSQASARSLGPLLMRPDACRGGTGHRPFVASPCTLCALQTFPFLTRLLSARFHQSTAASCAWAAARWPPGKQGREPPTQAGLTRLLPRSGIELLGGQPENTLAYVVDLSTNGALLHRGSPLRRAWPVPHHTPRRPPAPEMHPRVLEASTAMGHSLRASQEPF